LDSDTRFRTFQLGKARSGALIREALKIYTSTHPEPLFINPIREMITTNLARIRRLELVASADREDMNSLMNLFSRSHLAESDIRGLSFTVRTTNHAPEAPETDLTFTISFLACFRALRVLSLKGANLNWSTTQGLESLQLRHVHIPSFDQLDKTLRNCPRLKSLDLSFCDLTSLEGLPLSQNVLRLDHLEELRVFHYDEKFYGPLFRTIHPSNSLHLSTDSESLFDEGMSVLPHILCCVTTLGVWGWDWEQLVDERLSNWFSALSRLETLLIVDGYMRDDVLEVLYRSPNLKYCPRLRKLHLESLSGCHPLVLADFVVARTRGIAKQGWVRLQTLWADCITPDDVTQVEIDLARDRIQDCVEELRWSWSW
jgi:hypothetical protein